MTFKFYELNTSARGRIRASILHGQRPVTELRRQQRLWGISEVSVLATLISHRDPMTEHRITAAQMDAIRGDMKAELEKLQKINALEYVNEHHIARQRLWQDVLRVVISTPTLGLTQRGLMLGKTANEFHYYMRRLNKEVNNG